LVELISLGGVSVVVVGFLLYKITKLQKEYKLSENNLQQSELRIATLMERTATLEQLHTKYSQLEDEYKEQNKYISTLKEENSQYKTSLNNKESRVVEIIEEFSNLKTVFETLQLNSTKDKELISQLQTQLSEQKNAMDEKVRDLKENEEKLKTQFTNLANEILDTNSKKFSEQNTQNLSLILNPMKQQLQDFKKKVEDVYDKEAKDRSLLSHELKTLKELNQKMSQDAQNLTTALKGENKTQGSWGEMVLEKVLESSGLRLGEEYTREITLKNDDGEKYRPDVIVNLPANRQVIIDAKTSLTNYEQYVSSTDEIEKMNYLTLHIKSINTHIDSLSNKRYEELKGVNTLDFIFMFIPIESALMLAMETDKGLFDKAFKKKIVLVSPTTLLVALKAVENSWRYEKQAQSTTEVIRLAEKLYSKVRTFVEDFEKVGKNLTQAQKSYDEAYKKLSSGKDNIVRQIEVFKDKSNISPSKQISQDIVDSAMVDMIEEVND
jgi:DNA recombination protein RmuC